MGVQFKTMSALALDDQKTSLEETLREHTRDVMKRVRQVPGLGFNANTNEDVEDVMTQNKSLIDLFRPSNHVFLGIWQRTTYISGAWPLVLSGVNTAHVGLSGYDSPSGVVWRFVKPEQKNINSSSNGSNSSDTGSDNVSSYNAYLELVDHPLYRSGEQHLYLSRDLSLVSSKMEAALFLIERVKPFRNGPADHAIRLSIDGGFTSTGDGARLVLCTTGGKSSGGSGEVLFVHSDRLNSMNSDGTYLYNIAFETTPDSDATVQMEMEKDDVPIESYLDYTFRMDK